MSDSRYARLWSEGKQQWKSYFHGGFDNDFDKFEFDNFYKQRSYDLIYHDDYIDHHANFYFKFKLYFCHYD